MAFNKFSPTLRPKTFPKYAFQITLPTLFDINTPGRRDPRKVWLYDSGMKSWDVTEDFYTATKTYSFGFEDDYIMFLLRWQTTNIT